MALDELAGLKNLGPKSATMMQAAGIHTAEQIRSLGSVGTYLLVQQKHGPTSLNFLWALEGFIRDIDWRELSQTDKAELQKELDA